MVHRTGRYTEGAKALWVRLSELGWSQYVLQQKIGAPTGMVSRWLYGERVPTAKWVSAIEAATGVPSRLWGEPSNGGEFSAPDESSTNVTADRPSRAG